MVSQLSVQTRGQGPDDMPAHIKAALTQGRACTSGSTGAAAASASWCCT
jgi:hypothetical protein